MHFYLIPPTGKTLPVKVISPVMDKFYRTGIFKYKDNKQVIIVIPADGPSFFVAPYGK